MRISDQLQDVEAVRKFDPAKAARDSFIDRTKPVKKKPFCLSFLQGLEEIGVLTSGDFSVVTGPPKCRKTFLVTMIVAAMLNPGKDICGMMRGKLPEGQQGILYLDTEQSDWHSFAAVKRVEELAGVENDPLFRPHMLRDYSTEERKATFEYLIANTPELGFVVIDGIRDLVTSINDEKETKEIVDWIMAISKRYSCHIMVVIHENKVGGQIRGVLGTELQNKAQAVLGVKKVDNDEVSIVVSREARDKHFQPFAIYYNEETKLPDIDHDYEIKPEKGKGAGKFNPPPKKKRLDQFTRREHHEYLKEVFAFSEQLSGRDLRANVSEVYSRYSDFYKKDAEKCAGYLLTEGLLESNQSEEKASNMQRYWISDRLKKEFSPF